MIPKIIHFIYVGGREFSFIHFLAVFTAWKVHRPECIYFHHTVLPTGHWWDKARPLLNLNEVEPVAEVFGNPVKYLAHMADVIRLEQLQKHGGIYLDLDVISLKPFDELLQNNFVMGMEAGVGLCNAVIMSRPGAPFLKRWREQYRSFDGSRWNYHSVILPWQLAQQHPEQLHVANQYAFFYPTHDDPVHSYLWGKQPRPFDLAARVTTNVLRLAWYTLRGTRDAVSMARVSCFHALRGADWHFRRANKSYCLHLWESFWGEPYLNRVTPEYLRSNNSHFARLLRGVISDDELQSLEQTH